MNDIAPQCRICAKPIPAGARKCTECKEYQNPLWRILAGLDLKGLIALVPIVTLAFAFIQDRIDKKASDLRIALVSCEAQSVSLFASNVGNRAAIIKSASSTTNDLSPQPLLVTLSPADRMIDTGETRSIQLRVDPKKNPGGLVPYEERDKEVCKVTVTLETIAFNHDLESKEIECDCPK